MSGPERIEKRFRIEGTLTAGNIFGALGTLQADLAKTIADADPEDYRDSQAEQGIVTELRIEPVS